MKMNELSLTGIEKRDFIKGIEDRSDELFTRAHINFKNGKAISIVRGEYSYGGPQGLFEIAIKDMNNDEEWMPEVFDEEDQGDDVLGYLNVDRVHYYIEKVGNLEAD